MLFLVLAFVNSVQPQTTVYLPTCEPTSTRYLTPCQSPISTERSLESRLLQIRAADYMGGDENVPILQYADRVTIVRPHQDWTFGSW